MLFCPNFLLGRAKDLPFPWAHYITPEIFFFLYVWLFPWKTVMKSTDRGVPDWLAARVWSIANLRTRKPRINEVNIVAYYNSQSIYTLGSVINVALHVINFRFVSSGFILIKTGTFFSIYDFLIYHKVSDSFFEDLEKYIRVGLL